MTKISHDSASFHTGYTSSYYEEENIKYVAGNPGYTTYLDYDQNYLLEELNRDDGYKEEYSYDSHGNIEEKNISHTSINKHIKYEYEYNSSDCLISESKLVGSSIKTATYQYDSFGNISIYPAFLSVIILLFSSL